MSNHTVSVQYPDFYPRFHCIGPACSDNCCHDWPIEIDKAHYLQYKAAKHPDFLPLCRQYVHRLKKDATDHRYARLSLDPQGRCGFQDGDGGCRLIRTLGEEKLSLTCTLYPRRKAEFGAGQWELSLSMSCEEVVRIGVLEPPKITFSQESRTFSSSDPLFQQPCAGIGPKGKPAQPPVWGSSLRTVCIHLMQTRELTIPQRLMAIYLLLRRLDRWIASNQESQIPAETIRFLQTIESGGIADFFRQLQYEESAHLTALRLPMAHLLSGRQGIASRQFMDFLRPHLTQSGGSWQAGSQAAAALLERIRSQADPALEAHSIWMENYFVNYLFSSLFPFFYRSEGFSLEEHGLLLLQQYGLLRCLLAVDPSSEPETAFTRAMVHTARLSQHSSFASDLQNLLTALGLSSSYMTYLIR